MRNLKFPVATHPEAYYESWTYNGVHSFGCTYTRERKSLAVYVHPNLRHKYFVACVSTESHDAGFSSDKSSMSSPIPSLPRFSFLIESLLRWTHHTQIHITDVHVQIYRHRDIDTYMDVYIERRVYTEIYIEDYK